MDGNALWLSVAAPPPTQRDCLQTAAEHFSFCPTADGADPRPLRAYAAALRSRNRWRFRWS